MTYRHDPERLAERRRRISRERRIQHLGRTVLAVSGPVPGTPACRCSTCEGARLYRSDLTLDRRLRVGGRR